MLTGGIAFSEVKEVLGHADIKTTMRYAHLEKGESQLLQASLDGPYRSSVFCGHERSRVTSVEFIREHLFFILGPSLSDTLRELCSADQAGGHLIDCKNTCGQSRFTSILLTILFLGNSSPVSGSTPCTSDWMTVRALWNWSLSLGCMAGLPLNSVVCSTCGR